MNPNTSFGLGRIASPDARDAAFPLRSLVPAGGRTSGKQLWATGQILDQSTFPFCVGYALRDWLDAAPISEPLSVPPTAETIYHEAQALDGDPSVHEGTSVRAGAKALRNRGLITSYHWATDYRDVVDYVLNVGPCVFGTNFYRRMFVPSKTGLVSIGGGIAGGHAYLCFGVETAKQHLYFQNSWGTSYGNNGCFLMTFATVKRLLAEQGECLAALGKVTPQG